MRSPVLVLAAAVTTAVPAPHRAPQSPNVTTFIIVQGKDTVSLEQFTRAGNTVTGVWISNQSGQVQVHDYVLTLGADGLPARYEMAVSFPDGAGHLPPSEAKYSMVFGPDSLTRVTGLVRPVTSVRVSGPKTMEYVASLGGRCPAPSGKLTAISYRAGKPSAPKVST